MYTTLNVYSGMVRKFEGPPHHLLRYIANHFAEKAAAENWDIGKLGSKMRLGARKRTCHARTQLLATNTLARQVALETWRKEIAATLVLRYADNLAKAQILGVLDDLIE